MWTTLLTGLLTGLSLIVAIGAQNAFVLRQGLRGEHLGTVVAICIGSDVLLVSAGTLGIGALVTRFPSVLTALLWAGAAYLLWFAATSFRSAVHPSGLVEQAPRSHGSVVATTLAMTYLNPHVYLDTVVMLGNLANQHGSTLRWAFVAGAGTASLLWFLALGYGARALAGPLGRPATWRVLDTVIGLVMVALAARLVLS